MIIKCMFKYKCILYMCMNFNKIGKSCNIDISEICFIYDINLSVKC